MTIEELKALEVVYLHAVGLAEASLRNPQDTAAQDAMRDFEPLFVLSDMILQPGVRTQTQELMKMEVERKRLERKAKVSAFDVLPQEIKVKEIEAGRKE